MTNSNSLINLGELSKPATVLIEKISNAVGGIFKPYQITRIAKAEAEAELIRAETEIQITDLHRRAMHRFIEEEAQRQENIESIASQSIPLLRENSEPNRIDDDWITNFFDKCRIVSNKEMQQLWSRILASEANSPGEFSRRTVNLLSDLDKRDAEIFTALCGFKWVIRNESQPLVLIFDHQHDIYNSQGINFNTLSHLEALGLIHFNASDGFKWEQLPKTLTLFYFDTPVELTMHKDKDNDLELGLVLLTNAGQELATICTPTTHKRFFDYVCERWANQNLIIPQPETKQADEPKIE